MAKLVKRYDKIKPSSSDTIIERILKTRGIAEEDQINFIAPDKSDELDQNDIRNLQEAVTLIMKHVRKGHKITVSGDPDADGITSLAIMVNRFRELQNEYDGFEIDYIYAQRDTGHGILGQLTVKEQWDETNKEDKKLIDLSLENIEKVENTDLLIILDSSSNDIEGVNRAREIKEGLDVIILDHHEFNDLETQDKMDELAVLVNIQHSDDISLNKELSGAGVSWKVCKGIDEYTENYGFSDQYLDLVAVGLIGDMMSMAEPENRYLVAQGLQNVTNIGLLRILKGAKVNLFKYSSKDIGFSVAPLINASSRMGQIELSIQILLAETDKEAMPIRLKMSKLNDKRKEFQASVFKKYQDSVDLNDKIIIIVDNESNKGFNGLVAQNMAQKYHRPCFVVRDVNGMCMGSGRSYGGFNTQEFLNETGFVEASGHAQAHGISFPSDKLDELKQYIAKNMEDDVEKTHTIYYDVELGMDDYWNEIEDIQSLNYITGKGFPEVVVKVSNLMIEDRQVIGKTKETVKFIGENGLVLIKFKVNEDWNEDIGLFDKVTAVGAPAINEFYNFATKETTRTPQILIQDITKEF